MSDTVMTRGFTESVDLPASSERVFEFLDDFENLGSHMTRSSWMMAGSSMHYEFDAARGRETGARVRISGSFLGLRLQIDEMVDDREPPSRKSWRTVDAQRMWVIAAYRMGFSVDATRGGSRVTLFVDYALPPSGVGRVLGLLFGARYARWCVRSMLAAATRRFTSEHAQQTAVPAHGRPSP